MEHLSQFQGAGGALIVSLIAFTIVFLVLIGLTLVIFAIKFFAGSEGKKDSGTPSAPVVAAAPAAAVSALAPQPPAGKSQITAAITAAILTATQGRGRVLSVSPALQSGIAPAPRTTWKTTGIVERISGRLVRPWKH